MRASQVDDNLRKKKRKEPKELPLILNMIIYKAQHSMTYGTEPYRYWMNDSDTLVATLSFMHNIKEEKYVAWVCMFLSCETWFAVSGKDTQI